MDEQCSELLQAFIKLSSTESNEDVQSAQSFIDNVLSENIGGFILYSAQILSMDEIPLQGYQQALILIGNVIKPKANMPLSAIVRGWQGISLENRMFVKNSLIRGLFINDRVCRNSAALDIALYAAIEFSLEEWTEILEELASIFDTDFDINCKVGAFVAFSELAYGRMIKTEMQGYESSGIKLFQFFTVFLSDINDSLGVLYEEVVFSFTSILLAYDQFILGDEQQRIEFVIFLKNIMESITDPKLVREFYRILYTIYSDFYNEFPSIAPILVDISNNSFSTNDKETIVKVLEFWEECFRYEETINDEIQFLARMKRNQIHKFQNVGNEIGINLIPLLINLLQIIETEEIIIDDYNDVNIAHVAQSCLSALADISPQIVSNSVIEFIEKSFTEENLTLNVTNAILLSIRCISQCSPDLIDYFLEDRFDLFLSFIENDSLIIQCNTIETMRVLIKNSYLIKCKSKFIGKIISIIHPVYMTKEPIFMRIACNLFLTFSQTLNEDVYESTFADIYSTIYEILQNLFQREDMFEANMYIAVCEALGQLILHSPYELKPLIINTLDMTIDSINSIMYQRPGVEDIFLFDSLIAYLISVIWSISKRIQKEIASHADKTLEVLVHALSLNSVIIYDEALLTISNLICYLGSGADAYREKIIEQLKFAQQSGNEQVIHLSCLAIFDLFATFKQEMLPYYQTFHQLLINNLHNNDLTLRPKLNIIRTIGIIIINIGIQGVELIPQYWNDLKEFQTINFDLNIPEEKRQAIYLYEAILYGYMCVARAAVLYEQVEEFVRNYRDVSRLFDRIRKIPFIDDDNFYSTVFTYIEAVTPFIKRINLFLNKNSVKGLLNDGAQSKNTKVSMHSRRFYRMITNS